MTAHEQYRDDLPLYSVGALSSEESERLQRHLAGCFACREELNSLNEAAAQMRSRWSRRHCQRIFVNN